MALMPVAKNDARFRPKNCISYFDRQVFCVVLILYPPCVMDWRSHYESFQCVPNYSRWNNLLNFRRIPWPSVTVFRLKSDGCPYRGYRSIVKKAADFKFYACSKWPSGRLHHSSSYPYVRSAKKQNSLDSLKDSPSDFSSLYVEVCRLNSSQSRPLIT